MSFRYQIVRNEENNAERCIESLVNQDYSNYEILVLDDNSADNTPQILERLSKKYNHLRVFKGKELPEDWFGKHWAYHHLSTLEKGEYLFFTDADTFHSPKTLSKSVNTSLKYKKALLTAFVKEETLTVGEKLTIPFVQRIIFAIMPTIIGYLFKVPGLSATIGQFMFFKREAFDAIGGYEAVKKMLPIIWLSGNLLSKENSDGDYSMP